MTPSLAITGVTGALGSRVARALSRHGKPLRLVARDPKRVPALPQCDVKEAAYRDAEAMRRALVGVETLFLVSAKEAADRVAVHKSAVDAAIAAGISHVVYLSFLGAAPDATFTFARDHYATEQYIRQKGIDFTFLRSCLYMDLAAHLVRADDAIAGPAGEGRAAWVSRDDIADVATRILLAENGAHKNVVYDVTGREALSLDDVAEDLSRVLGRIISYRRETLGEARSARQTFGVPAWEVEGWITSYAAMAAGEMSLVSDTVPRLTGHRAQTLREYLDRHPEDYARLKRR